MAGFVQNCVAEEPIRFMPQLGAGLVVFLLLSITPGLEAAYPVPSTTDTMDTIQYAAAKAATVRGPGEVPVYTYEIIHVWPHDPEAFTQGLVFHDGVLLESTGLHGHSSLRKIALETGKVLQYLRLPLQYFAEGIALFDGKVYQLTWRSGKGFIYSLERLRPLGEFVYEGEGWGLTQDGHYLIMSDGTNRLRFLDPTDFTVRKTLDVYGGDTPIERLNELEYVNGEIYANVWHSDRIARVDPGSGQVKGWIDLSGLLVPSARRQDAVLNGIAYDKAHDRLFVTGKLWPKVFEIRLKSGAEATP